MPSDGEASRKRPRTDDDADVTSSNHTAERVRDTMHYREDGDCFVLVENTMFKIHKFQLTRDSSAFSDLVKLPAPDGLQQMTEAEPLVLQDKVSEFRALCWAVYAAPTEIQDQSDINRVKFDTLVSLFIIANKYQFTSYEKWSKELIIKHCTHTSQLNRNRFLDNGPLIRMLQLMKVAQISNSTVMMTAMQAAWLRRLERDPAESASQVLEVANAYDLRELQGQVYYQQLLRQRGALIQDSTAYGLTATTLTKEQENRLYRGFWSLSCHWVALQAHNMTNGPPRKDGCSADYHNALCVRSWKTVWTTSAKRAAERIAPSVFMDIKGQFLLISERVNEAAPSLDPETPFLARFPATGKCGLREIRRLIDEFPLKLADHFLGP